MKNCCAKRNAMAQINPPSPPAPTMPTTPECPPELPPDEIPSQPSPMEDPPDKKLPLTDPVTPAGNAKGVNPSYSWLVANKSK